jgi:hypothetical protein
MLSGLIVLSLLALLAAAALAGTVRDLLTDGYRRLPAWRTAERAERPRRPRPPRSPRRVPRTASLRAAGMR